MGERNTLCIRGHASKNKLDRLPLHIHVSRSRFIASWHNVRTINVSYVARLSHYRDSLTCCSFKYKMYTALANKTFWVCGCPLWRDGGVCLSFSLSVCVCERLSASPPCPQLYVLAFVRLSPRIPLSLCTNACSHGARCQEIWPHATGGR